MIEYVLKGINDQGRVVGETISAVDATLDGALRQEIVGKANRLARRKGVVRILIDIAIPVKTETADAK